MCGSPPQPGIVNEWQQLSRRTLSAALLCLCVCGCVCVLERERDSGGAATRAVSLGTLSGELTVVLSSSATGLFFSFSPWPSCSFHPRVTLWISFPSSSLWETFIEPSEAVVTRRLPLQGKDRTRGRGERERS